MIATIVLIAQLSLWCQEHIGQRIVLGEFPYFGCVERGADCKLYPSPCTDSEIALILAVGGIYQPPAPTPTPIPRMPVVPVRPRGKTTTIPPRPVKP